MKSDSENQQFSQLMAGAQQYYQSKEALSPVALKMYSMALADYSYGDIEKAMFAHMQCAGGQFFPKASDLIKRMTGGEITPDEIITAARMKITPLGAFAYAHIGSWDLDNQTDAFYLKSRATEVLTLLPEWKRRAAIGQYTDRELSILLKHKISPLAPFHDGMAGASNEEELRARARIILGGDDYKRLTAETYSAQDDISQDGDPAEILSAIMAQFDEKKGDEYV